MITTMWDHNKYMEYRKTNSLRNEFEKGSRDFALLVAAFTVEVVFVGLVAQLLNHYNLKKKHVLCLANCATYLVRHEAHFGGILSIIIVNDSGFPHFVVPFVFGIYGGVGIDTRHRGHTADLNTKNKEKRKNVRAEALAHS